MCVHTFTCWSVERLQSTQRVHGWRPTFLTASSRSKLVEANFLDRQNESITDSKFEYKEGPILLEANSTC